MNVNSINAIIFDLGGVILDLDYGLTINGFNKLGCKDFNSLYNQQKQNQLFDDFETGKISAVEFRKNLQNQMTISVTDKDFDSAWNAMLLKLPIKRIELLQRLKKNYPIFLLSNTNEIHIKAFQKIIASSIGYTTFTNCFNKVYYSSEIGLRKPSAACFKMVLNENNLTAEKTLFIDDSAQHINGAKAIGIRTHLLKKQEDLTSLFPDTIL
ncbi:MAG: HAD family hydrolase [Crocinitomicaceae bacterium]|nr:HAD family hydrolase [Crocinitomicaceae bacterium]